MQIIIALLAAGLTMGVLDGVWLGLIAKKLYYDHLGSVLLEKFNMVPALAFYAIYVVGVVVFVVNPALAKGSLAHAAGYGALFGLVAYATYDLTNLAVTRGFSPMIALIDMAWGAFLTAVVASAAYLAVTYFVK